MSTLVLAILVAVFAAIVIYLATGDFDLGNSNCTYEDYEIADEIANRL